MIETLFLLIIIISIFVGTMKRPKNFPPGPIPLPIVGSYLMVDQLSPQKTFDAMYEKFGCVVGIILPLYKLVVVNGYEAVKEALLNDDILGRPTDVCLIRDRFEGENYGVLFTDGENWKSQRRFTLHHFRNLGFGRKNHENVMKDEAEALVEKVKSMNGRPFSIEELLVISGINITWALIGNRRYSYDDPILKELAENIKMSIHSVKSLGSVAVVFPFLRYLFPNQTGYNCVSRGSKGIIEFTRKAIADHLNNQEKESQTDFIDIYLNQLQNKKEEYFSQKQLEGLCVDMLCAGADTSSAVISFAILFMCLRNNIQERMYQEIKDHVGGHSTPSMEDKLKLVYTEATLMEVLRYRTPAPTVIPHRATVDTKLSGYNVPKDSIIYINMKSVFMDPHHWQDADSFRPERFVTMDGKIKRDERLFPFGKGKRSCLGETLAKMSTFILLSTLVQRFHFSLPTNLPLPDTEGIHGFTLVPPPFLVIATPRP